VPLRHAPVVLRVSHPSFLLSNRFRSLVSAQLRQPRSS
jgi:hypothetical protein